MDSAQIEMANNEDLFREFLKFKENKKQDDGPTQSSSNRNNTITQFLKNAIYYGGGARKKGKKKRLWVDLLLGLPKKTLWVGDCFSCMLIYSMI